MNTVVSLTVHYNLNSCTTVPVNYYTTAPVQVLYSNTTGTTVLCCTVQIHNTVAGSYHLNNVYVCVLLYSSMHMNRSLIN